MTPNLLEERWKIWVGFWILDFGFWIKDWSNRKIHVSITQIEEETHLSIDQIYEVEFDV